MLRAIETSVIVAERLGVAYEVTDALREFDCGSAEGRADQAAWQMWHEVFDAWTITGGGSSASRAARASATSATAFGPFVEGLVAQYGNTDADLLCVAHGGVLWMMLPLVLTNVDNDLMSQHGFGHTTCIVSELGAERPALCWNGTV